MHAKRRGKNEHKYAERNFFHDHFLPMIRQRRKAYCSVKVASLTPKRRAGYSSSLPSVSS